jgi:hypothetical protein
VVEGKVTIVWGDSPLMRLRRALPTSFPGSLHTVVEECLIESITASEIVLRAGDGDSYKLRLAPAE